mmetsp:Transcript_5956/g.9685  ORF Transcript_5956/g.9685 Transcript_5956/m.9685 type:complete len:111 (-) Transcript_5956:133-465(-)
MSTSVGDESQLRRRKAETEAQKLAQSNKPDGDDNEEVDATTKEYIEYFRSKYGDNPRADFLGVDGLALFCLIYVVVAGVVLSILYFSVYARNRVLFGAFGASSTPLEPVK